MPEKGPYGSPTKTRTGMLCTLSYPVEWKDCRYHHRHRRHTNTCRIGSVWEALAFDVQGTSSHAPLSLCRSPELCGCIDTTTTAGIQTIDIRDCDPPLPCGG